MAFGITQPGSARLGDGSTVRLAHFFFGFGSLSRTALASSGESASNPFIAWSSGNWIFMGGRRAFLLERVRSDFLLLLAIEFPFVLIVQLKEPCSAAELDH